MAVGTGLRNAGSRVAGMPLRQAPAGFRRAWRTNGRGRPYGAKKRERRRGSETRGHAMRHRAIATRRNWVAENQGFDQQLTSSGGLSGAGCRIQIHVLKRGQWGSWQVKSHERGGSSSRGQEACWRQVPRDRRSVRTGGGCGRRWSNDGAIDTRTGPPASCERTECTPGLGTDGNDIFYNITGSSVNQRTSQTMTCTPGAGPRCRLRVGYLVRQRHTGLAPQSGKRPVPGKNDAALRLCYTRAHFWRLHAMPNFFARNSDTLITVGTIALAFIGHRHGHRPAI